MNNSSTSFIFISYSHAAELDNRLAQELADNFSMSKIPCFLDTKSLKTGDEYSQVIENRIHEIDIFIVLLSINSIKNDYVYAETSLAKKLKKRILPIMIEEFDLPLNWSVLLGQILFFNYKDNIDKIFTELSIELGITFDNVNLSNSNISPFLLCMMGAKGGVGKSTIACRIAEMIAESGHNVLIIDLDTGTGGSTVLQRDRGNLNNQSNSVYQILRELTKGTNIKTNNEKPLDVTPDYLSDIEGTGRLFLLPAVPYNLNPREPTHELLKQIDSKMTKQFAEKVMDRIIDEAQLDRLNIKCLIFDCGAEGAEFNPLVSEAHRRASLSYIIVQPDPVSKANLMHVCQLLTGDDIVQDSNKIRIIMNRVISYQHEISISSQFSNYHVSGFIPDDPIMFEDIQKDRLKHRYGYDTISKALHGILKRDVPGDLVPQEIGLWARPTARAIIELAIVKYLRNKYGFIYLTRWLFFFLLPIIAIFFSIREIYLITSDSAIDQIKQNNSLGSIINNVIEILKTKSIINHLIIIYCVIVVIGIAFFIVLCFRFKPWVGRLMLIRKLIRILKQSKAPQKDLENFLFTTNESERNYYRIDWLRNIIN